MFMKATIRIRSDADELERRAATELQRYIRTLFGFTAAISPRESGVVIELVVDNESLKSEQYVLRRRNAKRMELRAGSSEALQWAAYELIEHWGVTYLVQGDVLPDKCGPFRLPNINVKRSPVFERRAFRIINDMANSGVLWSLADHEKLFDQLTKLRFNTVYAAVYPTHPWCHWSYRGVERDAADVVYGFRHVVHERTIGKEHFGRLGHYTNPDLQGAETYEQKIVAGRRLMHGIIAAAHRRGLQFILTHIPNNFPDEIKVHLPRFSKRYRIPRSSIKGTQAFKIGLEYDAGNFRFGELLTPLNPAYIDMAESWTAAHLEEYPEVDGLGLWGVEFPPPSGGIEKCWRDMDRRHGLSPRFTYDKIIRQARKVKMIGGNNRGLREAQGAIATVRLLDILLNERKRISGMLKPGAKIFGNFMSEALMPVLPYVFDAEQFEFLSIVDYLPADVADRAHVLDFTRGTDFKAHLVTTINDDNVGFLPQFNTTVLHKTVRAMRKYGVKGFWFRQFDISEYEPVMAYMAEAGWDHTATPRKTYERQVERICGKDAVKPMLKAFRMLEASLKDANAVIGAGFMMPHLVAKYWRYAIDGEVKQTITTFPLLIEQYSAIEPVLDQALAASEPRGKQYAGDILAFTRFARLYCRSILAVYRAGMSFVKAEKLEGSCGSSDRTAIDRYDNLRCEVAELLQQALADLEQATQIWSDSVRDRTDVGSLLGLNVYGLDWLRGKADEARLRSEVWAFSI